jgi:hypothetical protein
MAHEFVSKQAGDWQESTQQKGTRGMPWLLQARKDVASDETLRGPAGTGRSAGIRMGQPGGVTHHHHTIV